MTYARQEGDYNIVYHETLDYAFKHGEPELFRMSRRCDYDCCSRIIDMTERWSSDTEEERRERQMKIVEEFGLERCLYIMAATVRGNSRIDFPDNLHDWAEKIRISDDRFVNATNVILSKLEPLLDFISTVQRLEAEEKKKAEEAAAADPGKDASETSEDDPGKDASETSAKDAQNARDVASDVAAKDVQDAQVNAPVAASNGTQEERESAQETSTKDAREARESAQETSTQETQEAEDIATDASAKDTQEARETAQGTSTKGAQEAKENASETSAKDAQDARESAQERSAQGAQEEKDAMEAAAKDAEEAQEASKKSPSRRGALRPAQGASREAQDAEDAQGALRDAENGEAAEGTSAENETGASSDELVDDLKREGGAPDGDFSSVEASTGDVADDPKREEAAPDGASRGARDPFSNLSNEEKGLSAASREGTKDLSSDAGKDAPQAASAGSDVRDDMPSAATMQYGPGGDAAEDGLSGGAIGGWTETRLPASAVIVEYPQSFFCRMPYSGERAGYVFNIPSTLMGRVADGDGYVARIPSDFKVRLRRDGEEETLSAEDFAAAVAGKSDEDFKRPAEKKTEVTLPLSALAEERERSYLFALPGGSTFFLGKSLVKKDSGGFTASIRESLKVKLIGGKEAGEISPERLKTIVEEADWEGFAPSSGGSKWRRLSLPSAAAAERNERRTLFKMPDGEYSGCVFWFPTKLTREEKDGYSLSLPADFEADLLTEDGKKVATLSAEALCSALDGKLDGKGEERGETPGFVRIGKSGFLRERAIRENVPRELRDAPNWVIVRTRENEATGRLSEYFVSPATGAFAVSDDPSSWSDFETACRYAEENGGDALAFALDGKGACCLEIPRRDGYLSETAKKALSAAPEGTYMERTLAGDGVRIFGKLSSSLALRSFSRDGEIEFYRGAHFVTVTGEREGEGRNILSFDTPEMKGFLRSNFDKRRIYRNAGKGYEGVSDLSDRELLDKAFSSKGGETMRRLFEGEDVKGNPASSDMALMNRLAFWCDGDRERMLRLFAASGLYRADKGSDYYEAAMLRALQGMTERYSPKPPKGDDKKPGPEKPKHDPDKGGSGK